MSSPGSVPVREEGMQTSSHGSVPVRQEESLVGGRCANVMCTDDNPEIASTGLWDLVRLPCVTELLQSAALVCMLNLPHFFNI